MRSSLVIGECNKNKVTALVVDDNKIERSIHKNLLRKLCVDSYEVENGKEAVNLCRSGSLFDLILMDMDMPIMNGPEATSQLRSMGVRSKIVGVTSRSSELEKESFMAVGLDDYKEKPLKKAELNSIIEEIKRNN